LLQTKFALLTLDRPLVTASGLADSRCDARENFRSPWSSLLVAVKCSVRLLEPARISPPVPPNDCPVASNDESCRRQALAAVPAIQTKFGDLLEVRRADPSFAAIFELDPVKPICRPLFKLIQLKHDFTYLAGTRSRAKRLISKTLP
jgi:hypothetical protein